MKELFKDYTVNQLIIHKVKAERASIINFDAGRPYMAQLYKERAQLIAEIIEERKAKQ